MARKDVSTLRDEAVRAVERGKLRQAIEAYEELERRQPADPSWPKRLGEVHRRAGDDAAAIAAFERAAERYAQAGFLVQAIAVCKLILQLDPSHSATAHRLAELSPVRPAPPARAVTIPPGAALDAVSLSEVVPRSQRLKHDDGTDSGIILIPIEEVEVIAEDPAETHTAIDAAIAAADPEPSVPGAARPPPVPPPRAPASVSPASPASLDREARRALVTTPLLAGLPARALEALIGRLSLVNLDLFEVLFKEGERGQTLYVVSEGEVVVTAEAAEAVGEGDRPVAQELARLGPGAFFGEIGLVTDLPRSATVRAAGAPVELLAIDRDVVRELVVDHPDVLGVLLRFVRDRLVDKVTRTSELFRPFTDAERAELSRRFELVEVDPGTPLIVQGERADGLYVVLAGRAQVWRDGDDAPVAALGPGEVFGEMSLLAGGGSTAHVRAATRVLALRMPARTFREVIMTHPQVLSYVGELAERRRPADDAVDTGDLVDLRLDLL